MLKPLAPADATELAGYLDQLLIHEQAARLIHEEAAESHRHRLALKRRAYALAGKPDAGTVYLIKGASFIADTDGTLRRLADPLPPQFERNPVVDLREIDTSPDPLAFDWEIINSEGRLFVQVEHAELVLAEILEAPTGKATFSKRTLRVASAIEKVPALLKVVESTKRLLAAIEPAELSRAAYETRLFAATGECSRLIAAVDPEWEAAEVASMRASGEISPA